MNLDTVQYGAPRNDVSSLLMRIAELEQTERSLREDLRRVEEERRHQSEELSLSKKLVDHALDGITLTSMAGVVVFCNPAFAEMSGFGDRAVGRTLAEYYTPENFLLLEREVVPVLIRDGRWHGILEIKRPDGSQWMGQTSAFLITDAFRKPTGMAAIFRDVTADLAAAADRAALQIQVIEAQEAALRELSTPLMPIADGVVAMPLIGEIDAARAHQILDALLRGIAKHRAPVAILDITGVPVVDVQVASALVGAARAAGHLGAEVVLTGMTPAVAQSLVGLGTDLRGITTLGNFQTGIAYALERRRRGPRRLRT